MRTCTWAPTTFQGTQVVERRATPVVIPKGPDLQERLGGIVAHYETLGLTDLLIAQRWWGNGEDIEDSSLDCLAMTAAFAMQTQSINLITAIHPGFFQPTAIAKWGATIAALSGGRWSINVTSGWNMEEFDMYGIDKLDHDTRYTRSAEFIEVLRGAWHERGFSYRGNYYTADNLHLDPAPDGQLEVFQGGQSDAAIAMGAKHSDYMFINGGSLERVSAVAERLRNACAETGREVKLAMYAAPLCRSTDEEAWAEIKTRIEAIDPDLLQRRRNRLAEGAQGMWGDDDEVLSALDTNEGYAARLIGSPETIFERIESFQKVGIEMLHLDVRDSLFNAEVLPLLRRL